MNIRNKITIIIIPIVIAITVLFNYAFEVFFKNYLQTQENALLKAAEESVDSFISGRKAKYLATNNDWGHWDETYRYVNGDEPQYIKKNLSADTFKNLDISFIVFEKGGSVISKFFYDISKASLTTFPIVDLKNLIKLEKLYRIKDDRSGIYALGNNFYIVSATDITDSSGTQRTDARMFIGRKIDRNVIQEIRDITGASEVSLDVINPRQAWRKISVSKNDRDAVLRLILTEAADQGPSIRFTLFVPRNLYLAGMSQVKKFVLIDTFAMGLILLAVFGMLGRYISRPFDALLKDVKGIDLSKKEFTKLDIYGDGEFNFLRRSINSMLVEIEVEHQKLRDSNEKLYTTLVSVGDGVITVDKRGIVQFINPAAQKLTGWTMEETLDLPIDAIFNVVNEYTREPEKSPIKEVFEKEEVVERTSHTLLISKDGTEKLIEDIAAPIKDKSGSTVGCVLVFKDFSEDKEKQRRIEYLSYYDELTGVYNRQFFQKELKHSASKKNMPISFVYANLNGLRTINDAFGHEIGDQVLQRVAELLKLACRQNDIVARVGGDEFVLLFSKTDQIAVEKRVKQIIGMIDGESFMGTGLSVSFGWDTYGLDTQFINEIIRTAENRMYQKKIANNSSSQNRIIRSILNTLQAECPHEKPHADRVSKLCEAIGSSYNLSSGELRELVTAGELHDIGKITVDRAILNKPSKLSESDWAQIRKHPDAGYRILSTLKEFSKVAEYVLGHHERYDGKGYPKGLRGDDIPWQSRVIAIADAYDTMISDLPYRRTLSKEEAIHEIKKYAGTQFDGDIVRVFIEKVLESKW